MSLLRSLRISFARLYRHVAPPELSLRPGTGFWRPLIALTTRARSLAVSKKQTSARPKPHACLEPTSGKTLFAHRTRLTDGCRAGDVPAITNFVSRVQHFIACPITFFIRFFSQF